MQPSAERVLGLKTTQAVETVKNILTWYRSVILSPGADIGIYYFYFESEKWPERLCTDGSCSELIRFKPRSILITTRVYMFKMATQSRKKRIYSWIFLPLEQKMY